MGLGLGLEIGLGLGLGLGLELRVAPVFPSSTSSPLLHVLFLRRAGAEWLCVSARLLSVGRAGA